MDKEDSTILEALEQLGLALVKHNHQWTPELRRLYERAVAIISKRVDGQREYKPEDIGG